MRKLLPKFIIVPLCLFLFSIQCDDDITPITQEDEEQELTVLKSKIEDLASSSICGDTFECKFIAFGSKPCGGPWSYLVYSTSIDTDTLESMVEGYNRKEALYNAEWGIPSDCALVNPPSTINCENNTCVAVF